MKNKIIALNRMYNGEYLELGNLGHEVINLYKSDNGNDYLYLQYSGKFSANLRGQFGCVLLVRGVGKRRLEIIGKAEQIEDIYGVEDQKEYIKKEKITYAGVALDEIFRSNDTQQETFITFKAKTVRPIKPLYIQYGGDATDGDTIVLHETNQAKTSLKQYITEQSAIDYKSLLKIIDDKELWDSGIECVDASKGAQLKETMFDICGISYSELAYSHALYHFLSSDTEFAEAFVVDVLGIKEGLTGNYKVYREWHNIDLFIEDEKRAIIIENKIKSSINGVFTDVAKTQKDSQLDRYIETVERVCKGKDIHPFLLAPNYNKIDISDYNHKKQYRHLYYRDLYEFMKSYKAYSSDPHFRDFTDAQERHTAEYDNELYYTMSTLFLKRIEEKRAHL
ncbi:MAG: PD-(D/E)XK nuclease family protein [Rikenellaceae bacterium]